MHKTARWASSAKRAVPGEMSVTGFPSHRPHPLLTDTGPVVDLILIGSTRANGVCPAGSLARTTFTAPEGGEPRGHRPRTALHQARCQRKG